MNMPSTRLLWLAACLAWPGLTAAQEHFATAEQAVEAFVSALGTQPPDEARFGQLLGEDWRTYIPRGGVQHRDVDTFLTQYAKAHRIERTAEHRARLAVGDAHWTLPIPLVQGANGWHFDLKAGSAEIRARRIGRNELAVLQSMLAYHDAQMEYASQDRNGNGALEYARRIFSTPGQHDGLYWADDGDGQISPLGPLFGQEQAGEDWYGYHFRILEAQGPSAPGGAYDYLIGDRMSRGFALVAWPARYDDSGVMSFMISHDGEVFEKDLGPQGEQVAKAMKRFDPDSSWKPVAVAGE
ncbi:DUF2950 domain-containing protein [Pseudomonas sichuanensis]|uniref:DUF2950 domain-containing protein n=1 Tax=Pseudomonas sichuanensis TaxID=2213015 RepID=UPI00244B9568|nr:DUF2950 domain-containing protein [Pseudomonas sichuanensis]MDH0733497.1 DUF2950 domain-containing protein [Pseudomonas sichuanensis]MDH1585481.1 DUF2950 domain-containing protein [Pseudomonas sichuanensis]MDH1594288.1 DUF2950 domain-containing protein [Pseudomonas sichuanensis]MDH1599083.1 DUF2950 domain-containing protein [Pseudomonas sichuanensis]